MQERRLALEGAVNCRDIGGYRTGDHRHVRWGRVWRSDAPSHLSMADRVALSARGLRTVIDLRHPDEQVLQPSRLLGEPAWRVHAIGFVPRAARHLWAALRDGTVLTPRAANDMLLALYRQFPVDHADAYAQLFRLLLQPGALPALVHCTSGKDRTGFGVALLLGVLGVAREAIVEDYLLTNHYRRDIAFMLGERVDAEVLEVVTSARAEYLDAAFATIESRWGSLRQYCLDALQLRPDDLAWLQQLLLEES